MSSILDSATAPVNPDSSPIAEPIEHDAQGGDAPLKHLARIRQTGSEESHIADLQARLGITDEPQIQPPKGGDSRIQNLQNAIGLDPTPSPEFHQPVPQAQDQKGAMGPVDVIKKEMAYGKQMVAGVADAVQNTWNAAVDLSDWGDKKLFEAGFESQPHNLSQFKTTFAKDAFPTSANWDENAVRGITQFMVPFLGWSKALRAGQAVTALGKFGLSSAAGAATSATALDPNGGRGADLLNQYAPWLRNPVSEYLATNKNESDAEGRFKNALDGLGLGVLTEGLFHTFRIIKGAAVAKEAARGEIPGAVSAEAKAVETAPPLPTVNPDFAGKESPVSQGPRPRPTLPPNQEGVFPRIPPGTENPLTVVEATPEQLQSVQGSEPVSSGRAINIDLNKINANTDIKGMIDTVAKSFPEEINAARRGVITDEALQGLANDVGLSVRDLVTRQGGEAFNAETMLASRRVLHASAENLIEKAKIAVSGGDVEKAAFLDSLDAHRAIQAQVSGAIAEAGRTLRSLNSVVGLPDGIEKARIVKQILDLSGGSNSVADLANIMSKLANPSDINQAIAKSRFMNIKDAVWTTYTNGLLANPRTFFVKTMADTISTVTRPVENAIAAGIGKLRGAAPVDRITFGQIGAELTGMQQALGDAYDIGVKAFKTGRTTMDNNRFYESMGASQYFSDVTAHNVVAKESQTLMDAAAQSIASFVSLPSKSLVGVTEFYKTLNYRGSIYSQAIKESERAGLTGEAFSNNIAKLIANPTQDMMMRANDVMREATFTKPMQGWQEGWDSVIQKNPPLRVLTPFYKIKLNLVDAALQRSPFAPILQSVRADLAAGGATRDLALSRIALGTSVIASTALLASKGFITGGGPANIASRKLMEDTGWQKYSFHFGDSYYNYEKIEPWATLLKMGADVGSVISQIDSMQPGEGENIALAAGAHIGHQFSPDFLLETVSKLNEVLKSDEPSKHAKPWIADMATGAVPFSGLLRATARAIDPVKRDVRPDMQSGSELWSMIENRFKAEIPWFSKDLPPARNLFGQPIVLGPGYGYDSFSPIYTTGPKKLSPIAEEMVALGMTGTLLKPEADPAKQYLQVDVPPRYIKEGGVTRKLSPQEYDQFAQLSAGIGLQGFNGVTLEDRLNGVVKDNFREELGDLAKNNNMRAIVIKKWISTYRRAAQGQLINGIGMGSEDKIQSDLRQMQQKRIESLSIQ